LSNFERQASRAAPDVEDPLARLRVEQVERGLAKLGNEGSDRGVIASVPLAGRGDGLDQSVFTQSR
jgi:hypothetical protein